MNSPFGPDRLTGRRSTPTVNGMSADNFVSYTTPRRTTPTGAVVGGSTVVLPNLTAEQQAAAVHALERDGQTEAATPQEAAKGETTSCGKCGGAGGWNEPVETKTGGGGTVVTQKWVNCRPCGGSGQVPK